MTSTTTAPPAAADPAPADTPARPSWRRRLPSDHVGTIAVMVAVAITASWPLGASISTAVPLNLIDSMEGTWIFGWIAHAIVNQPLDLFDGNIFHPSSLSLAFAENLIGVGVLVAPVYWVTDNPILTANVAYLLLLTLSGYGTALLVRELTGAWVPGVIAGAAVAAAPYEVFNLPHVHVIATHFVPFILLLLVRIARDGPTWKRTFGVTVLLVWQFWSSLTGGMIAVVAAGAWGFILFLRSRDKVKIVLHGAVAAVAAVVLIFPLAYVYRAVQHNHPEYQRSPEEVLAFSVEPRSYLAPATGGGLFEPQWHRMRDEFGSYPNFAWERWLFPGLWLYIAGATGLAIAALQVIRRAPPRWHPWSALAAATLGTTAFVMTLGPRWGLDPDGFPLPFLIVNRAIPGVGMRVPGRFAVLVVIALALIGGLALGAARGKARAILVAASVAILAAETIPARFPIAEAPRITKANRAVASAPGAVLQLPTLELGPDGVITGPSMIREPIQLYLSTAHFRPVINGYAAFVPARTFEILREIQDFPSDAGFATLEELDVRTVVVQTEMIEGTPWADVVTELEQWSGVTLRASGPGVRVYDITRAA